MPAMPAGTTLSLPWEASLGRMSSALTQPSVSRSNLANFSPPLADSSHGHDGRQSLSYRAPLLPPPNKRVLIEKPTRTTLRPSP